MRSWSPWIWCDTPLRPSSLTNLPISLALSVEMPTLRVTVWRTVPFEASSTLPYPSAFSDTWRFTNFSSSTCVSAVRRPSLSVASSISFSFSSMELPVFLKSKRVEISRDAWSTALRTSCMSSSDTTSNVGMARLRKVIAWECGKGGLILYAAPGRYPSGQRGQAVNLLRKLRWFESNPAHSEHPLHLDHVEPLAELASHLPLGAHGLEPAGGVERDRCVVVTRDAGDHRVEAVRGGEVEQLLEHEPAD